MRVWLAMAAGAMVLASGPVGAQEELTGLMAPLAAPADPVQYYADIAQANAAIARQDYAAAEPLLERATRAYALDPDTWFALGMVKRRLNKPAEAAAAYERMSALGGRSYRWARERLALMQMQAGDHGAALETWERLVSEDGYLDRGGMLADERLAPLRQYPRFHALAGDLATDGLTREQGWRLDLDFLLAEIRRLSPVYRSAALPERVTAIHRELHEGVSRLTDEQMFAGMARLLGALDQNHTMMWGRGPAGEAAPAHPALRYLPMQFYFFPEGLFVVRAQDQDLVGAQVLAIEGTPTLAAFTRLRETISAGGAAEALWTAPARFADLAVMNGVGLTARADEAQLRLRLRDGRVTTRRFVGVREQLLGKLPAPPRVAAPAWLARISESHWVEVWQGGAAVYAQINQIAPDPDETLPDFGLRLRRLLAEHGARNLIIDLRNNNGGDTFTYVELLRTIIAFSSEPAHRVYVLIGRNTYSAAANLTTELGRLADPVFVGEPTSAIGNQDGDEGFIRLPWSGLRATVAGTRWQLSDPWDERPSQAPDVPVQLHAGDYFAGRDPALDAVRRLIAISR